MRGQKTLFADLFETSLTPKEKQRPRNYFLPERNEALVYRYYFHAEVNRLRYDDCLVNLEREFYLTTPRLIVVLSCNSDLLSEIIKKRPSTRELETKFPHFSWKARF